MRTPPKLWCPRMEWSPMQLSFTTTYDNIPKSPWWSCGDILSVQGTMRFNMISQVDQLTTSFISTDCQTAWLRGLCLSCATTDDHQIVWSLNLRSTTCAMKFDFIPFLTSVQFYNYSTEEMIRWWFHFYAAAVCTDISTFTWIRLVLHRAVGCQQSCLQQWYSHCQDQLPHTHFTCPRRCSHPHFPGQESMSSYIIEYSAAPRVSLFT